MNALPLWRRLAAGVASLVGLAGMFMTVNGSERVIAIVPLVFLLAAAFLVHVPRLGAQLLTRAAWWSNFTLGFFIAVVGGHREAMGAFVMTTALGIALLLIGPKGMNEASERTGFAPSVFRTTFMLLMILVLADAQTLGLFAIAFGHDRITTEFCVTAIGAVCLIGAFVGLYRLTLWGVLGSLGTSLAVAVALLWKHESEHELAVFVALFCGLQIVVAAPMLICILAKRSLPKAPPLVGIWFSRVAIVGMWLYSLSRTYIYY